MPVYEYKCQQCGTSFELMVRSYEAGPELKCPSCGTSKIQKVFSAPALVKNTCGDSGGTCCGRQQRCDTPGCGDGGGCCH